MSFNESGVQFFNTEHLHVAKPKLVTCKEDFQAEFLAVLRELGWFQHELLPLDIQHPPGIGIGVHLERVALTARTNPQSLSLVFAAINHGQAPNWTELPDALKNHFPAKRYLDRTS